MYYSYLIDSINKDKNINQFLLDHFFSKSLISAIKYQGGLIQVNSKKENVDYILKIDDKLEIYLPKEIENDNFKATNMDLDIVYEDGYIIIINKKPNVPTIPSRRNNDFTLANGVKYYYKQKKIHSNIHFINRLDKDTSGLVMIAKDRYIHHVFSNYVNFEKKYLAIACGKITNDIIIEANIKRENELSTKRIVNIDGQYAKTKVKVLKIINELTLVELTLFTGRTHQIRVHLNHINHPLLGDDLYNMKSNLIDRVALHSFYLCFTHPFSNERLVFTINMPLDMLNIVNRKAF